MTETLPYTRLPYALLAIRITSGLFLLQWAIEKFVKPEATINIFSHFYGIGNLSATAAYILGSLQLVIVLAFLAGFRKRISYGLCFLMHFVSTASTWSYLINPYEKSNHVFFTAVPVLAAMWALYYLRDLDSISVDTKRSTKISA